MEVQEAIITIVNSFIKCLSQPIFTTMYNEISKREIEFDVLLTIKL